jgi:tetratricopeptide (TPR) repeat protein
MVWAVALYVLALFLNYPHYMATLYRAYHTHEDFNKYRVFTVHITGLLLTTVFLSHLYPRVLPWIFTLYLTWSPWHYSGQNYGLFMMFARRAGASPNQSQRRALYAAFLISYFILFLSLYTGPSSDPLFLSPGIPEGVARPVTAVLGIAFTVAVMYGLSGLLRQVKVGKLIPALTLISTQFLWFLLPSFLWLADDWRVPASRYSTGVLAIMHSAQYLWITSYYARREATGQRPQAWRPFAYFAILMAGGIALFIPGPWLASYVFHYDFTTSFLIFTALVNLHHFILDGAIWKLRDGRIAALLLNSKERVVAAGRETGGWVFTQARWIAGPSASARGLRISLAVGLIALSGVDRFRFLLSSGESTLARAERAAALNPYDSTAQLRLAELQLRNGHPDAAVEAWKRALKERPFDPTARNQLLQYWTNTQQFQQAYDLARASVEQSPRDADLLMNYGLLAEKLGHEEDAEQSWQRALRLDRGQWRAHLYLGESLRRNHKYEDAIPQFAMYLNRIARSGIESRPAAAEIVPVILHLADCQAHTNRDADARRSFELAAQIAVQGGQKRLESLAVVQQAEYEITRQNLSQAMSLYQRALKLDAEISDSATEAVDWYNYGLLLRRRGYPERLVSACLWKAQMLLDSVPAQPETRLIAAELKRARSSESVRAGQPQVALQQALSVK